MPIDPPPAAATGRPLSLDELVLLNEEIRALMAAGIPLDVGLRGSASRLAGPLGRLSERLAARIERGASLESALSDEGTQLPSEYRAIVSAGLRSGRFDAVLASVTKFAAAMRELNSHVARALVYPIMVIAIAYLLFIGVLYVLIPAVMHTFEVFRIEPGWWISSLNAIRGSARVWGPIIPAVCILALIGPALWRRLVLGSRNSGRISGVVRVIPGIGGVLRNAQQARFAHLLSILTEYRVPLPEALRLSAATTGDARLTAAMEQAATLVESGQPLERALPDGDGVPALLRWLMIIGEQQASLPVMLRQAAEVYQQRATIRAEWIQRVLPVALVLLIGGGTTALYALTVFVPMASLWRNLGS
jgi:general secretion pathway protein F